MNYKTCQQDNEITGNRLPVVLARSDTKLPAISTSEVDPTFGRALCLRKLP